ncbi:Uncharacterised protein [Mycobacteroides abscessus subsp. massiliense]|nr:Uncharacterised protein [Mycobacteroides abscessus subsp. massiliense]SKM35680.1 Uncharacterised protein [Mycobacteroides abscessus subsp. massiliense]SKP09657.1 Uncharacterised protein [Mycobacteroides abscessus subsp. massiliense]SKP95117.1 Uncharacterised protein [Mycobacteroides abscessus subsp. massiliense]SLK59345.1 Uncharacterised protein [Mycobacteroides abscessus subsp. massiliense]
MKEFRKYLSITIFALSVVDFVASVVELVENIKLERQA